MRRVVGLMLGVTLALAGLSALSAPERADAANFQDVTLRITHVTERQAADGDGTDGDFFPKVEIAGGGEQSRGPIEDDDFDVDWRITQSVDLDAGPFPIRIELWDDDDTFAGGDDHVDISPTNQDVNLDITYDPASRTWTSPDLPANATHAVGDGDPNFPDTNDGTSTEIAFDIFVGPRPDTDGDGIPDSVERFGVRDANNNVVGALNSSPCRKSIAIEIDWMQGAGDGHSHQPKPAAITELVGAFNSAPVPATTPCPYPGTSTAAGVDMVILPGNAIPEQPIMGLGADFQAARDANFNKALRPYAHYDIFVHDQAAGTSSSGLCCESTQGNKDFIVSLGSWHTSCVGAGKNGTLDTAPTGDDQNTGTSLNLGADRTCNTTATGDDTQDEPVGTGADVNQVGSAHEQAGTIMHELGHALGLGHGGADTVNFKPNYVSNENYRFQFGIPTAPATSHLDYSRVALPTLNERSLNEAAGISDGTDFTAWTDPTGKLQWSIGNAAINWDQKAPTTVAVDLNNDNACIFAGANGMLNTSAAAGDLMNGVQIDEGTDGDCDTTPSGDDVDATLLYGYDDWTNIKYRAVEATTAGGESAHMHTNPDITFAERVAAERQFLDYFHPDVKVTKSVDQADAEGGDSLGYTVGLSNIGPGDARVVGLDDTLPDGSVQHRSIGDLDAGTTTSRAFTYDIPCATVDGTILVNNAVADAKDRSGRAEQDVTNNAASASTTVHAPKLTMSKSSTANVNAGEAITYVITYGNTGSATARNIVITDVLPADVYYSAALDLGVGPKPDSVVHNSNGTTTLRWNAADLAPGGSRTIGYTARPGLLFIGGQSVANSASAAFGNAAGCVFAPVTASASSAITVVPATRNPLSHGYWATHDADRTAELRARVQATDQRFDEAPADGALSNPESETVLSGTGNQARVLRFQLLATYFDLADRRINAATLIDSKTARRLGLANVRAAALYAQATLALPVNSSTRARYDDATTVLDEIVNNKSPRY